MEEYLPLAFLIAVVIVAAVIVGVARAKKLRPKLITKLFQAEYYIDVPPGYRILTGPDAERWLAALHEYEDSLGLLTKTERLAWQKRIGELKELCRLAQARAHGHRRAQLTGRSPLSLI